MELRLQFESDVARRVVEYFPSFRGSALAASMLFYVLPCSSTVTLFVAGKEFRLDLKYRSHMTYVRAGPTWIEPGVVRFVIETLKQGDVFFDLGSNWGFYTVLASVLVGDRGTVISVEANPVPYFYLNQLLHGARIINTLAFNCALSDRSGETVTLTKPWYRTDTGGFVKSKEPGTDGGGIVTKTLDQMWAQLGKPQVRLVKLDTEGFEPKILRGGAAFLVEGVTDAAVIEVSEWTLERAGIPYAEIYEYMRDCGFNFYYIPKENSYVSSSRYEVGTKYPVNCNVIFTKHRLDEIES
jgi:FkbM family methyltransferase